MRKFKMIIVAILLVVVLTGVEIYAIRSASEYEPEVEVVFARQKIPEKTLITAEMLELKKVGLGTALRLSVRAAGEVVGKKALMDIEDGEMLLSSKAGLDEMQQITVMNKNNRLFSVEFKGDQANGWWVLADQYVDILFIPNETYNGAMAVSGGNIATSAGAGSTGSTPVGSGGIGGTSADSGTTIGTSNDSGSTIGTSAGSDITAGTSAGESSQDLLAIYPTGLKKIRVAALIDETGKLLENDNRLTLPRYISFEVTDKQAEFLAEAKGRGRLELSVIPEE